MLAAPPLALMTDDDRLPDPLSAARALPRGSLVVLRSRDRARLARLAADMAPIARARGLILVIAGQALPGADGVHLPEARLGEAASLRARHGGLFITGAVHSFAALGKALGLPFDALFLSAVFASKSHPGRAGLTPARANLIARAARLPVYALGGIDAKNAALLSPTSFCGIAAIGALDV